MRKISIVPRGRAALGYTLQLPTSDQFLLSRSDLIDRITGLLGGRAAEELVFGEVTTGAENDLEHATALARQMVGLYGMSESIGLAHVGQKQSLFLREAQEGATQPDCSEQTAREIDEEVKKLLSDAYESAKSILCAHRDQLERVAQELLKRESLDEQTFKALLGASGIGRSPRLARSERPPATESRKRAYFSNSEKNVLDIQRHRH